VGKYHADTCCALLVELLEASVDRPRCRLLALFSQLSVMLCPPKQIRALVRIGVERRIKVVVAAHGSRLTAIPT